MMKRFFPTSLLLLCILLAWSVQPVPGATLRDDLLRIHANLLPKTILMDYKFEQKLENNKILIDLLCRPTDNFSARKLRRYILEKYSNGIKGLAVEVNILNYCEVGRSLPPASLYYFFPAAPEQIIEAKKNVHKQRLVFVYDPNDLQYGAQVGLHIGRKIKPILNVDALKEDGITLRPALVRISEVYYQRKNQEKKFLGQIGD